MTRNVGTWDRAARGVAATVSMTCAVLAPLPLAVRVVGLALPALYVALTAIAGTCLGYRMMGRSTCPAASSR